ncbi:hypothetical protein [Alicyclobacillus sp. SO9]|uniref:hypothetical protein n=1 Tax=Alicyclobacillus sp. SO9 TaxID=2665646 RepID=UPI0018E7AED2|nr:hypothetical protein [Alicyclobacillus sp. SO9]QQE79669.1 hypothetical protein GI364_04045 [Alicyclobacillus sp. SO9]
MHKRGRFLLSGILTSVLTWVVAGPSVFAATAGMASPVGWKKYPFGNYVWDYFIKSGIHFNPLHGTVPTTMNQIANLLEPNEGPHHVPDAGVSGFCDSPETDYRTDCA